MFYGILSSIFCSCPLGKTVEFSTCSADFVDVEDVVFRSSEYTVR